jgi:hypothetical protein
VNKSTLMVRGMAALTVRDRAQMAVEPNRRKDAHRGD